jgi:glycosyltransferase involved in cell wall biosynthesis
MIYHLTRKLKQISKTSNINLILCIFLFSISYGFCAVPPDKRPERLHMQTSVAIPCCAKHFQHLHSLLQHYANQTQLPDETVISLSDVEQIAKDKIDNLEHLSWPFILKIIKSNGRKSAGENRNIAVAHCSNEVILCQDADDIPHPQRVEIVKFIFENYHVDHLMHLWLKPEFEFSVYIPEEVELIHHSRYPEAGNVFLMYKGWRSEVHNGNICLSKELSLRYKWNTGFQIGEDVNLNWRVYDQPTRTFVIREPLLIYRNKLSSFL